MSLSHIAPFHPKEVACPARPTDHQFAASSSLTEIGISAWWSDAAGAEGDVSAMTRRFPGQLNWRCPGAHVARGDAPSPCLTSHGATPS